MKKRGIDKINLTDYDARNYKGRQGYHTGYNAQVVVDRKHFLIVSSHVVSENNDFNQFSNEIERANEIVGRSCDVACADAGYSSANDLKLTVNKGITVVVPSQKQAYHNKKEENPFNKDKFKYNKKENVYICPAGEKLTYSYTKKEKPQKVYTTSKFTCQNCKLNQSNECTKSKKGRRISRLINEEIKENLEKIYDSELGKDIYKRRKEIEKTFGHIKRNLGGDYFLLRGLKGVNAEMAINASCFNIVRMINLLGGVEAFIEEIKTQKKDNPFFTGVVRQYNEKVAK